MPLLVFHHMISIFFLEILLICYLFLCSCNLPQRNKEYRQGCRKGFGCLRNLCFLAVLRFFSRRCITSNRATKTNELGLVRFDGEFFARSRARSNVPEPSTSFDSISSVLCAGYAERTVELVVTLEEF